MSFHGEEFHMDNVTWLGNSLPNRKNKFWERRKQNKNSGVKENRQVRRMEWQVINLGMSLVRRVTETVAHENQD